MDSLFTRRDFLKVWGLTVGSIAAAPVRSWFPPQDKHNPLGQGRVTIRAIGLYQEPTFASQRLKWLKRDEIVSVIAEIDSPDGPSPNSLWYRLVGGYAHSAYLQRVDGAHLNQPLEVIQEGGQLGEVTVPFSQAFRYLSSHSWQPLYRLYFGTVYWITEVLEGPDGVPWYALTDDRLRIQYCVPACHIHPITRGEIRPLSPHVPPEEKRIEISVADQFLRAFEGDDLVFQATLSTGVPSANPSPNGIPTETPKGNFNICRKTPSRHMGDGNLTSELDAYELPGVPWVSFFHAYGIGFHGTYWHDNFGSPMSHGCVNMRNEDAKWLYRWTTPRIRHSEWYKLGRGTLVQVT
jgi:hypothetical protein